MRHCFAVFGIALLLLAGCAQEAAPPAGDELPAESNPAAEKLGVEAARAWIALVDAGEYAKSWDEAAAYFKSAVTQAQWEGTAKVVREPLGKMVSRTVKSQQYTTSAPGAPDGEYVIVQFDSVFENKAAAVETITPMLDQDGAWRVSGYFIK